MAISKKKEQKLEQLIKDQLNKARSDGLLIGNRTVCAVILDRAKRENKTDAEKLADIISFCERNVKVSKKEGEKK